MTLRGGVAAAICALAGASAPAHAESITLERALARAGENPDVALAEADRAVAAGEVAQARQVRHNPELSLAAGPSWSPKVDSYEVEAALAQTVELGAKRRRRTAAARARLDVAAATVTVHERRAHAIVRAAFGQAVVARERVTVARDDEAVTKEIAAAARERLSLGAATQTEVNVAVAAAGRAAATAEEAERDYLRARAELAAAIGAPASADLEPVGPVPRTSTAAASADALVAASLSSRPELLALDADRRRADAELATAQAEAVPDVTISLSAARSGVDDIDAVLVGVAVPLPVWNRNQGGRAAARAAVRRAALAASIGRREIERQSRVAARRYQLASSAVAAFDREVIAALRENLTLARDAMSAGKIGLLELNTIRRDLVESQLAYLGALAEQIEAARDLELATGTAVEAP